MQSRYPFCDPLRSGSQQLARLFYGLFQTHHLFIGPFPRNRRDPPNPLGHRFFADNLEQPYLTRPLQVRPPAKLTRVTVFQFYYPDHLAVFLAEEGPQPLQLLGLRQRHLPRNYCHVRPHLLVHYPLDSAQLVFAHRLQMVEVKTQVFRPHSRTPLPNLLAQNLPQGLMQQVRSRVIPGRVQPCAAYLKPGLLPHGYLPTLELPHVYQPPCRQLCIAYSKPPRFSLDAPPIAHLPALLHVEAGPVQHQPHLLLARQLALIYKRPFLDPAQNLPRRRKPFVLIRIDGLRQTGLHCHQMRRLARRPGLFPGLLHQLLKGPDVNFQALLLGHQIRQIHRKAERVVQLECIFAAYRLILFLRPLCRFLENLYPSVKGPPKAFFLRKDHLLNQLRLGRYFPKRPPQRSHHRLNQPIDERLVHVQLPAVPCRPPKNPPKYITTPFIARQCPIGGSNHQRPDVIGNHPKGYLRLPVDFGVVLLGSQPFNPRKDLRKQIRVVIASLAPQHPDRALQSQPGVHVLGRQIM